MARDGIEPPTPAFSDLKISIDSQTKDGADGTVSSSKWLKDAACLGSILVPPRRGATDCDGAAADAESRSEFILCHSRRLPLMKAAGAHGGGQSRRPSQRSED